MKINNGVVVCILLAGVLPFIGLAMGTHQFLGFDDKVNIVDNINLKELSWEHVKWMFTSAKLGVYEPVSWLLKGTVFELFGFSAETIHRTSLVVHLANAFLLYYCAVIILTQIFQSEIYSRIQWVSVFTALIFTVHPLRVEVVAWASGQSYGVGAFFFLCAIVSYVNYCKRVEHQEPMYFWFIASVLFYICALFGKSAMVLLPIWLVLIDWYVFKRRNLKRIVFEKIPFLLVMVATVVVVAIVNEKAMGDTHQILTLSEKFGRAVIGLFIYPIQTIWPPNLTPSYAIPKWGINIWDTVPVLASTGLIVIVCVVMRLYKMNSWPFVVLFAYAVFLLPVLGFVQHGNPILVADRYTYVSTIPLYLAFAGLYLKQAFNPTVKRYFLVALVICLLLLSFMTIKQVGYWRNDIALWQRALQIHPHNVFAGNNLGFNYWFDKDYKSARKYLERAYSFGPQNEFPLLNLGVTYYELDRCDLAIEHYLEAAKTYHANSDGLFNNLGNCYIKLGEYKKSIPHFRRAMEINPNHPKAGKSLAMVLKHLKHLRK